MLPEARVYNIIIFILTIAIWLPNILIICSTVEKTIDSTIDNISGFEIWTTSMAKSQYR